MLNNLKWKCFDCEYSVICSGCRARAFFLTNDFMQEDSYCTYLPKGKEKIMQSLIWESSAEERLQKAQSFIRNFAKKEIEKFAIEN